MFDLARIAEVVLGALFLWAAVAKLVRFSAWTSAVASYGLPDRIRPVVLVVVPLAEVSTAALLVAGSGKLGAAMSITLLSAFSLAVLRGRSVVGARLPCGCFGRSGERDYRALLLRNAALGVIAGVVLLAPGGASSYVISVTASDLLPLSLTALGAAVLLWLVAEIARPLRGRDR